MFCNIVLALFLNLVFSEALLEKAYPHLENEASEYTSVRFLGGRSNGGRSKRGIGECFDDVLSFAITVDGNHMTLELEENTEIDLTRPVLVADDSGLVAHTVTSLGQTKYFQDPAQGAAIAVTYHFLPDGGCKYFLEGTFSSAKGTGLIHPSAHRHGEREGNHVIRFANSSMELYQDDGEGGRPIRQKRSSQGSRTKREAIRYEVELFLVADSLVYDFWYSRVDGDSPADKHDAAVRAIHWYFANIVNGIDLRYRSISEPDFSLAVLYSGIYIATTRGESPFSTGIAMENPADSERPLVDLPRSLDMFQEWAENNPLLSPRDHAMLFSKGDLTNNNRTTFAGLAVDGSAGTNSSVSVVEDIFDFIVIQIAAHQLGRSLGAGNDGTDDGIGGACSSNDHFIMSNVSGSFPGPTARNPWFFSSCSVAYFREYIAQLNSTTGTNSLLERSPSFDPGLLDGFLDVQPGQFYTIEQQCEYFFRDKASIFCRSLYNETLYPSVCERAYCSLPDDPALCLPMVPGRGTTCGDSKWCIDGRCAFDSNAPSGTRLDVCPQGDQPGEVAVGITCDDITAEYCYGEYYASVCCQRCFDFQTGNPDCLYGNRQFGCEAIERSSCYDFETVCCGTCGPLKQPADTGCEFGDRAAMCNPNECAQYNEFTLSVCCDTCRPNRPSSPATTVGDTTRATTTTVGDTTRATTTTVGDTTRATTTTVGDTTRATATTVGDTTRATATTVGDTTRATATTVGDTTRATATTVGDTTRATTAGIGENKTTDVTTKEAAANVTDSTPTRAATTSGVVASTEPKASTTQAVLTSSGSAPCVGGPCLTDIGVSGKCDTSQNSCIEPVVRVHPNTPLQDGPTLSCRFKEIVVDEGGSEPSGLTTVVTGDFLSANMVRCAVPGRTVPVLTGRRVAGWLVAVSNDGVAYGNEVVYLPVDGRCVACNIEEEPSCLWKGDQCFVGGSCYEDRATNPSVRCEQCRPEVSPITWFAPDEVCNIRGVCYAEGELNPSNNCEQCNVTSPSTWTKRFVRRNGGKLLPCEIVCSYIQQFRKHLDDVLCKLDSVPNSFIPSVCIFEDVSSLKCPGPAVPRYLAFCRHTVYRDAAKDPIACPPK